MTIDTNKPAGRRGSVQGGATGRRTNRTERPYGERKPDPVEEFRNSRQDRFISSLSANLNVMIQAVQKAGRGLARDFGELENLQIFSEASAADVIIKIRPHLAGLGPRRDYSIRPASACRWARPVRRDTGECARNKPACAAGRLC